MKVANVTVVIIVAILTGLFIAAGPKQDKIYFIAKYSMLSLLTLFLLVWAGTLVRLYRRVKNSDKLLPNKQVFLVHGVLLGVYLTFSALETCLAEAATHNTGSKRDIYFGVSDILLDIAKLSGTITFFLVVYLMLPLSAHQRRQRQ